MLHVSDVVNKDGKTKTKTKYSRQNWGTWTIVPHVSAMSSTKMATFPRASPTSTMLATWDQTYFNDIFQIYVNVIQIFEYFSNIWIFLRYFNIFQIFQYFSDISICFSYMFITNLGKVSDFTSLAFFLSLWMRAKSMLSLQSLCHIYCCLLGNLVFVLKIFNHQCIWMDRRWKYAFIENNCLCNEYTSYLSFSLNRQNFWRIKFTPKNANSSC